MKGLEISRSYFFDCGLPVLMEQFSDLMPHLCAGLVGSGSECYGFDDDVSRDHDFEPGFCLFLPDEETVSRQDAFRLERAYSRLPKEWLGLKRGIIDPVGGSRHGVIRLSDFLLEKTGSPNGILTDEMWLSLPDEALAEAVNGEIFYDGPGRMTELRKYLSRYPEDIFRKKLAGCLLMMAQSGQYNYARCLTHGEGGAAQLAVFEFVRHAMRVIFLLNGRYMPFYKWSFRAMRQLPELSLDAEVFEYLLTTDNEKELARDKQEAMDGVISDIIAALRARNLTKEKGQDLERHAYSVHSTITDANIRNMHILSFT